MTHGTRNATLAALWGAIVAGCIVNGCTYRTLEIQFRDVATKEPVEGVRVEARERGPKFRPTSDVEVTDSDGMARLKLRKDAVIGLFAGPAIRPDSSIYVDLGGQLDTRDQMIVDDDKFSVWFEQQKGLEGTEARWRLRR